VDGQFWRIYRDKHDASLGAHHCLALANGQRQRRFRSGLANRYCPGILRRAYATFNSNTYTNSATAESDGDGNSHTNYNTTAAITITDNNRFANSHPYLYASSSNSEATPKPATTPVTFVDEKETHCAVRFR